MLSHSRLALRAVVTSCSVALVLSSAGFGAVFAYKIGIEHSPLLAGLSVLMAIALEGIKPLAICASLSAFRTLDLMRGLALLTLGIVAIAYSITSELALVATSRGDLTATRTSLAEKLKDARNQINVANIELQRLQASRPSAELKAMIESKFASRKNLNGCVGWLASSLDRAVCIEIADLQAELGRAEKRDLLEADRRKAEQTIMSQSGSVEIADPGSKAITTYLAALGVVVSPDIVAQWLVLVPVLALEIGSALSGLVVLSFRESGSAGIPGQSQVVQAKISLARTIPTFNGSRDASSAAIMDLINRQGGSLVQSERQLAKLIGADRSTVRRAVHDLASSGRVLIEPGSRGTRIVEI